MPGPLQSDQSALESGLAMIFDMDGVLIDSNPLHREAWTIFNRRFGVETTEEMLLRMYGKRNDEIIRDYFGHDLDDAEVFARGAAKEAMYREMIETRLQDFLVPGVLAFLQTHTTTPKGVASNAEPANVDFLLDRGGLRRYFRAVVNGHQVQQPKPHPEIYLRTAELLDTPPADCIVFEDSHTGVEAARVAGMRVVGVCTTHGNLPGASITIDNFMSGDLIPWLAAQHRAL